ncbi:MAG: response regulator, partial [Lachnospiraceae bacterium]|nr:response regulator [Lachnospiraceae bacterium]
MKIIIVEDEIRIREGICNLVERIDDNYEVVAVASNGKDGYDSICEHSPDIVISDILMPEMNGIEMLEKLKNEGRMPDTILLSAYSEFSYAQTAIRLGVREYLTKPVTIDELTNALSRLECETASADLVPETLSSLNTVIFSVLNGILDVRGDMNRFLLNRYN